MKKADLEKLGLTAEALEKGGLDAEVLDKVLAVHGKDIETHKTKIATLETERDGVKTQLADANKAIEDFKKLDPEGIKKAADEWKAKADEAEKKVAEATKAADAKIAALNFDHALDGALSDAKAKNPKAVKALLKLDDLKLGEDGSIIGLKEQLELVQKDNDYLFSDGKEPPTIILGGATGAQLTGNAMVDAARKAAGLTKPAGEPAGKKEEK